MGFTWEELETMNKREGWHLPLPPICPRCEYNLSGKRHARCPECGLRINWDELQHRTRRMIFKAKRFKHVNRDAKFGMYCGAAAWGILLLLSLLRWRWCLFDTMLLLMAAAAFILGAKMIDVSRLPVWARELLGEDRPRLWIGLTAMGLGASIIPGLILLP